VPGDYVTEPIAVVGGLHFAALSAGGNHTCGITSEGKAYCWGANYWGQVGDGTTQPRPFPVAVVAISAGANGHTCGVTVGGGVFCWGGNGPGPAAADGFDGQDGGRLGDSTTQNRLVPTPVVNLP
jgi:alpha-tubulin suppressor-like RCC1 family protein